MGKGKGGGGEGGMASRNGKEVLKKITTRCWTPVNAHALIKEGTVFNYYSVFVQTDKNNSKSFWDLSQAQPNF